MMLHSILIAALLLAGSAASAQTKHFTVVDDAMIEEAVIEARAEFLKRVPFDRLDVTFLVKDADGTWRRGSHNPDALAYPASCVKLAYLAAAMEWSKENGHPYDHLDKALRPMIVDSSNTQTGVVVDAISGVENITDLTTTDDERYDEWLQKRLYTSRFLESRGLLGDQVVIHKTYPTNSGDSPAGAEKVARETMGMNLMSPRLSAELMLEVATGAGFEPAATAYMHDLLSHDRWLGNSVIGTAVPPGSLHLNKPGYAYDTLEDFAYVKLPNGQEFVMAIFTNGFIAPYKNEPKPYGRSFLGMFAEDLIDRVGLGEHNPPRLRIDNASEAFSIVGDWGTESLPTQWKESYRILSNGEGSATWDLAVPEAGRYEVCVLYPRRDDLDKKAVYTVHHSGGEESVTVDQSRCGGQWFRLGDYEFAKAEGRVTLTGTTVAADAVRIIKWPAE